MLFRQGRARLAVLLVFPMCYLLVLSNMKVMIVRNYICLAPFIAVLCAVTTGIFMSRIGALARIKSFNLVAATCLCFFIAVNASVVLRSGAWIDNGRPFNLQRAVELIQQSQSKGRVVFISNSALDHFSDFLDVSAISSGDLISPAALFIVSTQDLHAWRLAANIPNRFREFDKPLGAINQNYYPGGLPESKPRPIKIDISALKGMPIRDLFKLVE